METNHDSADIGTRFEPFSVDFQDELLAEARKSHPVFYSNELDAWVVTRHDDVKSVLSNPKAFSLATVPDRLAQLSSSAYAELAKTFSEVPVSIREDAVDQARRRVRTPIVNAFSPEKVSENADRVKEGIDTLIDRFICNGSADLMGDYSRKIPVIVKAPVLGIDLEDYEQFIEGTYDFMKLHSVAAQLPEDEQVELARRVVSYQKLMDRYAQERHSRPAGDLFSELVQAMSADGSTKLTVSERRQIVDGLTGLIAAGHFTTTASLGTTLFEAIKNREIWARIVEDPDLSGPAANELVRYRSPLRGLMRRTTKVVEIGGVVLPAGTELMVSYHSANRDERAFAEPDKIDISRAPSDHLGYGHGSRACVGQNLGHQILAMSLRQLSIRIPNIELSDSFVPTYLPGLHAILDTLPVRWKIQ